MHYNWHRYYDPSLGRYLSADPIGQAGGINVYSYAVNNPMSYVDTDGRNAYTLYHFTKNLLQLKGYVDDDGIHPGPEHDKYHHCMANCASLDDPAGDGEFAAWVLDLAKEEVFDRCRKTTGGSTGPDREDWDANAFGQGRFAGKSCQEWCSTGYPQSGHGM